MYLNIYRVTCIPGDIVVTTFNNTICNESSILQTVTINETVCAKYLDTSVPFMGAFQPFYVYATYGTIFSIYLIIYFIFDHVYI